MHFSKPILSVSVSVIIGYIGYAGSNNRLYRLCLVKQSVISIMLLGETIISVSVSVIIDYIDYAWANNRLYRLCFWEKR